MNSDRRYHHCDRRQSSQTPTSSSSSSTSTHCLLSHGVANQLILTPLVERRRNSLLAKMQLLIPPSQTNKFLQSKSSQRRKPSVQQIHSLKARSISEAAATESVQRIGAPPPYQRVGECLVYPSKGKPKGLIHFLGGAFIGAAPDVTYSFFIELLAKEGFLIVATPYNVTFDHTVSAQVIQNRFNRCLDILCTSSRFLPAELSPDDVAALPIFSVGHR
jgi:acetyl esterase/lipase